MRALALLTLAVLTGSVAWADDTLIFAGVAENKPVPGHPDALRIRVAFQDKASLWDALASISKNDTPGLVQAHLTGAVPVTTWTICAGHKAVAHGTGTVLESVDEWPDLGVGAIKPRRKLPFAGAPWLLATAGGRCDDPDGWKPVHDVPAEVLDRLANPMMRAASGLKLCRRDGSFVFYTPHSGGIAVKQSLRARDGRLLLVVAPRPGPGLRLCPDHPETYYNRLFVIDTKKEAHFLGRALRIVGAADLGGDGHSVVITSRDDGRFLGYTLFSHDLMRSTEFWWPTSDAIFDTLRKD